MMAGLLFARAGCRVHVLEKHADFFRDFRGDTVHPSTMEILDQLGMLERVPEAARTTKFARRARLAGRRWQIADFSPPSHVGAVHRDDAAMGFSRLPARGSEGLSRLSTCGWRRRSTCFIEEEGRVAGVRLKDGDRAAGAARPSRPTAAARSLAAALAARGARRADRRPLVPVAKDEDASNELAAATIGARRADRADRPRRLLAVRLRHPQGRRREVRWPRHRGVPADVARGGAGPAISAELEGLGPTSSC